MNDKGPVEHLPGTRPGDVVLRRARRPRRRLRVPSAGGIYRFLRHIFTRTPLLPMLAVVALLWLLFSAGLLFAERGAGGAAMNHYGEALWWGLMAMTTMGAAPTPVTGLGQVVGGIWAVVGCLMFYGTIIASVTAYFLLPRRHPTRELIGTIQYNLERFEDLSLEELETLKEVTTRVIEAQMHAAKKMPPSQEK